MVKRQQRGLARMESILDAARTVINELGWGKTTTNGIAAAAGISPGSFYQYFRNKDDIAEALIKQALTQLKAAHEASRQEIGDASLELPDALDAALGPLIDFNERHPWFSSLLRTLDPLTPVAALVVELEAKMVEAVALSLSARNILQPDETVTVAHGLLSIFRGFYSYADPSERPADLGEMRFAMLAYLQAHMDTSSSADTRWK